jgi:hypothetical protein
MGILVAASFVGWWFLASAWVKWRDPKTFAAILGTYPLLAPLRSALVVRVVPAVEGAIGLALLSVHPLALLYGASVALLFVASVSAVVAIRLARGERRFRCGCGGNLGESHSAAAVLARNAVIVTLLVCVIFHIESISDRTEPVLPAFLAGGGAMLGVRFAGAVRFAWRATREWKASG